MDFVRIDAADVVPERVTITLSEGADGNVLGRVTTIGTGQGGDEAVSTEDDDPPVEFALRIARELARAKGDDGIDIVDPDRLWPDSCGPLKT